MSKEQAVVGLHVVADGIRLHVLRFGTSECPGVVFAHGGGLNAYAWEPICTGLAPTHQCFAVDLRGHGDSEWSPSVDYSVEAHAHDLRHVIDALHLARPVVVGHSLGGYAALRHAEMHADRLAALVLVDTNPFIKGDEPAVAKVRAFIQSPGTFDTFDDALAHARTLSRKGEDALRRSLRRSLRQLPDGRWTWKRDQRCLDDRYFDAVVHDAQQLVPELGAVTCPTLVVRAEHGMSAHDTARLCAALPAATSATIPNAGHNIHRDNPAGLLDAIRRFLR